MPASGWKKRGHQQIHLRNHKTRICTALFVQILKVASLYYILYFVLNLQWTAIQVGSSQEPWHRQVRGALFLAYMIQEFSQTSLQELAWIELEQSRSIWIAINHLRFVQYHKHAQIFLVEGCAEVPYLTCDQAQHCSLPQSWSATAETCICNMC